MEGWVDIMNTGQNTLHPATWIFFVLLVFFGQFILINLVMARQATTPLLASPVSHLRLYLHSPLSSQSPRTAWGVAKVPIHR